MTSPNYKNKPKLIGLFDICCQPVWTTFCQASRRCTCVDLRWLRLLKSKSNLHPSRRKIFAVWLPSPSQRNLSDVLSCLQPISQWNAGFVCLNWVNLRGNLRVRLVTQSKTLRRLAVTCDYLRLRALLTRALKSHIIDRDRQLQIYFELVLLSPFFLLSYSINWHHCNWSQVNLAEYDDTDMSPWSFLSRFLEIFLYECAFRAWTAGI